MNESNIAVALSLNPCFLTCYQYGTLWPRTRNIVSWNATLLSLNRANITFRSVTPEEHTVHWDQSMDRFNRIIDAKIGHNDLYEGTHGLGIEINVEDDSMELNLETSEQYVLELSATNQTMLARINATTYFGARHGLETLSQLIAFDIFSSQLKVPNAFFTTCLHTYIHYLTDTIKCHYYRRTDV